MANIIMSDQNYMLSIYIEPTNQLIKTMKIMDDLGL